MSIFERLSQIITPPPRAGGPAGKSPTAADLRKRFGPNLRRHLNTLILTKRSNEPLASKAVNDLKQIAERSGFYETGTYMMMELESILRDPETPSPNHPERAYILAADFIFQHVVHTIDNLGTGEDSIGPNAFRLIVTDLIECLLRSEDVRRGVEIPVLCIDMLLVKSVEHFEKRELYLNCAAQTLFAVQDLAEEKFREDTLGQRKGGANTTGLRNPLSVIDKEVTQYVAEFLERFELLRSGLLRIEHVSEATADEAEAIDANLLEALEDTAPYAGYDGFAGWVYERLAIVLAPRDPTRSLKLVRQAAERYEKQGDREAGVLFTKLAKARYTKAQELYRRAGDKAQVDTLSRKLEQVAAKKG